MASGKKDSQGIALLSLSSIYGDEDDEMEDIDQGLEKEDDNVEDRDTNNVEDDSKNLNDSNDRIVASDSANDDTPPLSNDNSTPKPPNFGTSTPQQPQLSVLSPPPQPTPPPQQPIPSDLNKSIMGTLTIVDYGHDEFAMSPEAEEGEIVSTGRVMFGAELQTANGDFQEKTPPGTVQVLTPNTQATPPQSSEQLDPSQFDAMDYSINQTESAEAEEISVEVPQDVDPSDRFLPPPPKAKCSDELQEKIKKFLAYKKSGKSFNAEVRNRKEYRNPDFLLHAVMYQDIDQIGSCFSKDVFDPHGYDKSDYYDEIEADMKREMERKEQEKKKSQKVDFISGGTQSGTVASAPKINMPIPGVSTVAAAGGLHSVSAAADVVARDGRQNKKSKWDKVDGDRRNPLPAGGQDSSSAVGAHAALLSAANAGSGYSAFAQQRRREAEEKRSSEKRLERRT
uniref:SAP30-binding protein n=1 Tax=Davidia involucrata TaxID=16924 RepID=A0A5B7AXU5_DAVIN